MEQSLEDKNSKYSSEWIQPNDQEIFHYNLLPYFSPKLFFISNFPRYNIMYLGT